MGKMVNHLAIIMDGNGRWAKNKNKRRVFGHVKGARTARDIVEVCARLKIPHLTLYAFSNENWQRPEAEVILLMSLLRKYLVREAKKLMANNIRFNCIGDISRLPEATKKTILQTMETTKNNTGLSLNFAVSYGGRQEIVHAAKVLCKQAVDGKIDPDQIDELDFSNQLFTAHAPDPDLVIRTGGESRLSNFLTWQTVYSELYFTDVYWPEFTQKELQKALEFFSSRERRYGKVNNAASVQPANMLQ